MLAGTNSGSTMAEVHGLLDAGVSRALGRPVGAWPVIGYLDSVREPVLRLAGQPFDSDSVLNDIAAHVDRVIAAEGSFRATTRSAVFACS